MEKTYIKLGKNATMFYDLQSGVTVVKGQVVAIEYKTNAIVRSLSESHLSESTETEYNVYIDSLKEQNQQASDTAKKAKKTVDTAPQTPQ